MFKNKLEFKNNLDVSYFNLYDINFLRLDRTHVLLEIYINNNNLKSIDILNQYFHLKIIDAQNNRIQTVNLWLQKLETLNLQNNKIIQFPDFENMHELKTLNLNYNCIQNLKKFNP